MSDEEETCDILAKASEPVVSIESHEGREHPLSEGSHERRGSGFIIDHESHIITNSHMVEGINSVYVMHKGELLRGTVVDTSKSIDLALIKVEGELPVSKLGNSDNLRVGQKVYLIGNPFGLRGSPTVSSGIISGMNRSMRTQELFLLDLIQTDAHLNPGNSGGPLIDTQGKVIGVATANVFAAQGIGFSIPINLVKEYIDQIRTKGKYFIPWIGVDGITITPHMNEHFNLGTDHGVLVTNVIRKSPAEKAGISQSRWLSFLGVGEWSPDTYGSIISFNGLKLESFEEMLRTIRNAEIGSLIKLEILRKGRKRQIEVEIGQTS